jgi:hypothetical protein
MTTHYPAGTRVRVTFVGIIDQDGDVDLGDPEPTADSSAYLKERALEHAERVEVIEPDWQPGDIVIDADGEVYQYDPQPGGPEYFRWRTWLGRCSDHMVIGPLTLLARNGKPVPPPEQPQ